VAVELQLLLLQLQQLVLAPLLQPACVAAALLQPLLHLPPLLQQQVLLLLQL
jgi:hypothetical protein